MSAKNLENTILFQHLVKKTFTEDFLRYRELIGSVLAQSVGMSEQKVISGSTELMVEKVSGVTLSNLAEQMNEELKEMVNLKLAEKILTIRNEYRAKKEMIQEVFTGFCYRELIGRNLKSIMEVGGEVLLNKLKTLKEDKLTICHGDLNLSNVMLVGHKLALIDFEHITEAPVSFEFGSAILFDDDKSFCVAGIKKSLVALGVEISEDDMNLGAKLFLADQITKADRDKRKILIKKAKERNLI